MTRDSIFWTVLNVNSVIMLHVTFVRPSVLELEFESSDAYVIRYKWPIMMNWMRKVQGHHNLILKRLSLGSTSCCRQYIIFRLSRLGIECPTERYKSQRMRE